MQVWHRIVEIVTASGAAALVTLAASRGSTPRAAGARMVVRADGSFHGSIGGGRLEWDALALARAVLGGETPVRAQQPARFVHQSLGPDLGQCCGGQVTLIVEVFTEGDFDRLRVLAEAEAAGPFTTTSRVGADGRIERHCHGALPPGAAFPPAHGVPGPPGVWTETFGPRLTPVIVFGAGHVGRALILALAPLPFAVAWIDGRRDAFPPAIPGHVVTVSGQPPEPVLATAAAGSLVLIMTHDHGLDLALAAAALGREDLPFVGLIGSATKRARFVSRLRQGGFGEQALARLVCPIGVPGLAGKEPAIIAASVACQLLQLRDRTAAVPLPVPSPARFTAA